MLNFIILNMPIRKIKKATEEVEQKLRRKKMIELETEIIAALIFAVVSGLYISAKFSSKQLIDTIFLWMFPASITILLTLIIILLIEVFHRHD